VKSGKPEFPFCIAWANESWKGFSHGLTNREVLIEQTYPGIHDVEKHFYELLPAFSDARYIKVENKLLFIIYQPYLLPNPKEFIELWQELALKNGLRNIFFVAQVQVPTINAKGEDVCYNELTSLGFDAVNFIRFRVFLEHRSFVQKASERLRTQIFGLPSVYPYKRMVQYMNGPLDHMDNVFPSIMTGWDHTPRSGKYGMVLKDTTPYYFGQHVKRTLKDVVLKSRDKRVIFIKSWNEWAEGNYLEPDLVWRHQFLETLAKQISE